MTSVKTMQIYYLDRMNCNREKIKYKYKLLGCPDGRLQWLKGLLAEYGGCQVSYIIKMKHFLGHYDFPIPDWSQSEYEYSGESTI